MPYSSPATVSDGNVAPASWGNSVKAAADFLANPPACRVFNSATISLADAVETTLTFDSERFDTDNMHSTSVNTGRITFNTAGLYLITFHAQIASAADYVAWVLNIRLNGGGNIATQQTFQNVAGGGSPAQTVSTLWKCAVADYVEARAYQDNSANVSRVVNAATGHPNTPEFSAVWVGLG